MPTVFENYAKDALVDGHNVRLCLWDTAGQEEYDRLRPLSYKNTDVFLVCFAIDRPDSFANVEHKWMPELRRFEKRAKIILVGLKSDLRSSKQKSGSVIVTTEEALKLAKKSGAKRYLECSAKTQQGLHDVFDEAIRAVLIPSSSKSRKTLCSIL